MPDSIVSILIKFGLDAAAANKAEAEINNLSKATAEQTAAQEELNKSVKKYTSEEINELLKKNAAGTLSHKEMKDAIKGVSQAFPELGHFAHMALNPITFSVAGITASFLIWKQRVEALTVSLGGIQMPDISEDAIARIERSTIALQNQATAADAAKKAWGDAGAVMARYSAALDAAAANAKKILDAQKNLELSQAKTPSEILDIESRYGAAGVALDAETRNKRIAAMYRQQFQLDQEAKAGFAKAGKVGSKEEEAAVLADAKAMADAAQKNIAEAKARIAEAYSFQDASFLERFFTMPLLGTKLKLRYGEGFDPLKGGTQASELERPNIEGQQRFIDQYKRLLEAASNRDTRRGIQDEAQKKQAESFTLGNQIAVAAQTASAATATDRRAQLLSQMAAYNKAISDMQTKVAALNEDLARAFNEQGTLDPNREQQLIDMENQIKQLQADLRYTQAQGK